MPFVSMIDLDKSLTNNALFTDSDFDTSLPSMDNNLMKQINIQHQYSSSYHNNSAISLHQKLLLRTLNQLTNSTMFNGNNLHSLLSNSNGNLNTSIGNSPSSKQINYSRYKTELCRQFSENGECKYGDKCQFAHGFVDLKDVNRHPKYKTDFCKTFHSKGFCPYGPRCHFIHDLSEKFDSQIPNVVTTPNSNKSQLNAAAVSAAADLLLASKIKQHQNEMDKNQIDDYVMSLSILSNSSSSLSPSASSSSSTSSLSNKSVSPHLGNNSNLLSAVTKVSDDDEDEDEALSDPFQYSNQSTTSTSAQLEQLNNLLFSSPVQHNQFATQLTSYHQQRSRSMTSSTSSAYSSASSTSSINFNDLNPIKLNSNNNINNNKQNNLIIDENLINNQLLKTSTFDFFFP